MKRLREIIAEEMTCSMSLDLISDPVATECGQIYERESLEKWFAAAGSKKTIVDPNTGEQIRKTIIPLPKLRNILRYCEEYSENIKADISALEEADAKRNAPKPGDLVRATLTGDITAVKRVLANGGRPEETDAKGRTALHVAAEMGKEEIVEFLIHSNAPINAVTLHAKETPMMYACIFGKVEIVRILRLAGANEEKENALGKTAKDLCMNDQIRKVFDEDELAVLRTTLDNDSSSSEVEEFGKDAQKLRTPPSKKMRLESGISTEYYFDLDFSSSEKD